MQDLDVLEHILETTRVSAASILIIFFLTLLVRSTNSWGLSLQEITGAIK